MSIELEEIGFGKAEIAKMSQPLLNTIKKYYKNVELEALSKEALLSGAARLTEFFDPTQKIDVNSILSEEDLEDGQPKEGDLDESPGGESPEKTRAQSKPAGSQQSVAISSIENFLRDADSCSLSFILESLNILSQYAGKNASLLAFLDKMQKKYLKQQKEKEKLFIYFNSYLKKGKKTKELLDSNLFHVFKIETQKLVTLLEVKKPSSADEFIEKFRIMYVLQDSRFKEMLLLNMLYHCIDNTLKSAKKSVLTAYKNWPEKNEEKDSIAVHQELQKKFSI